MVNHVHLYNFGLRCPFEYIFVSLTLMSALCSVDSSEGFTGETPFGLTTMAFTNGRLIAPGIVEMKLAYGLPTRYVHILRLWRSVLLNPR